MAGKKGSGCGGPKGNKHALGCETSGRPIEYDRMQIAKDLIEWAQKPDSINLCKFCVLHDPMIAPSYLSIWAKEDKEFSKAYEMAKSFLGFRREEWLNSETLHVKAYDLNAETYDYFLKEEKQHKAQFESTLRKTEDAKPQTVIIEVKNDGLASGIEVSAKTVSDTNNQSSK